MMPVRYAHFTEPCCKAFRYLSSEFGFSEPKCETIGRETYVRFERGDQTVSIAYEPGSSPIVELFYPCTETGEPPIPWAEKNGTPRARRIPRLRVEEPFDENDPVSIRRHLQSSAKALEKAENGWLAI